MDPTFPYLFHTNKDVQQHNSNMLSVINKDPFSFIAKDSKIYALDKTKNAFNIRALPSTIKLKQNMLVELIEGNYSIEHGLVNGAEGLFRYYTKNNPGFIWIEFLDTKVGLLERNKMHHLFTSDIKYSWTPIKRITFQTTTESNSTVMRTQFLIQLACACTIHRAQGLTMEKLVFDTKGVVKHRLVYTALYRVKDTKFLYLLNRLEKKNFSLSPTIATEIERLQKTRAWNFQYGLHSIPNRNHILVFSLNTCSLRLHCDEVTNNNELMQLDILLLQETHLHFPPNENKIKDNYNRLTTFSVHGVLTLIKKKISFPI